MATFTVYETDGTSRGTVGPSDARWDHKQAEDGTGSCTVKGDIAANQLGETTVIRVNDGTADRFAFVPLSKTRTQVDAQGNVTELELSGPGVRWLLTAGQVLQEDLSSCALPADTRWFGWMSGDYDDATWTAPVSHGTWRGQPFSTPRPEGFPVPLAQFLWRTTDFDLGEEEVLFRQEFTTATKQDVVLCIAADDEYECWLDGTKLRAGNYGRDQLYNWKTYDQIPVSLCAGDHLFAVKGRNLPANVEGANPGWVIWAFAEAAGDGSPAAQNQIWTVTTDATGGTFTMQPTSAGTVTVDFDETAADLETLLEGVVGAGNVSVSGSAGDWTIEFVGAYANVSEGLYVVNTALDGETHLTKTEDQRGGSAKTVALSTATSVEHYYSAAGDEPGMTPGHILKTVMDEARARGTTVLDDVSDGYSATLDSKGDAWTFELNLPVALPATVHRVAVLLEEQGIDVWMDPDLTLQSANEQGQDDPIAATFTVGAGVSDLVATQEESTVQNVIRLRTTRGWVDVSDATSVTARGRWESGIILDGYDTAEQASPHTSLLLGDLATPPRRTTFSIPSEASQVPYVDFGLGDRVSAPTFGTSGFATDDMKVIGITGRLQGSSILWTVEPVD